MGLFRTRKAKYTDQDLRSLTIEGRDELAAQFEFLVKACREDRERLEAYFEQFGDLRYRPLISPAKPGIEATYGAPTEVAIEPLASQMRTAIASFLQSIALIQDKIMPSNDVEGKSRTTAEPSRSGARSKQSIRDAFHADAALEKPPIAPVDDEENESAAPTELVAKSNQTVQQPRNAAIESHGESHTETVPHGLKPWRETTPRSVGIPTEQPSATVQPTELVENAKAVPSETNKPATERTESVEPKVMSQPIGLSPQLRTAMATTSRMAGLRDKYSRK